MLTKYFRLSLVTVLFYGKLFAQNNTSPYSILGIGDIETNSYGKWSGMGSSGVALSSNRYNNPLNPASYSKLDNQFFNFEVSGRFKAINYLQKSSAVNQLRSSDLSMERLGVAIKLTKRWGSGVGLSPFSTANYSFYAPKNIQGANTTLPAYYTGTGGVNQVYWTNSYSFTKNLRAGIQASYLFGSLQQNEQLTSSINSSTYTTTRNIFLTSPYITYGLQYDAKISKKLAFSLGATYANKTKMNADYSYTVTEGTNTIATDSSVSTNNYKIPSTSSAGFALTYNNKLTLAGDYRHQDWSSINYKGLNYALVNSSRFSGGIEYAKKLTGVNSTFERFYYQAGFYYNNSYLQIGGVQLKDYGATIGFGLNSIRNPLGFSAAAQIGSRGTTNNGLIKENYTQFTFTLSYRDFWFTKGRKYD